MKVLLIAYACEPNKGSEPGIGWNWAVNLAKYVKVIVVTRKNNKYHIEEEIKKKGGIENLSFIYFDIPLIRKVKKYIPFGIQLYYLMWEFFIVKKIKENSSNIAQRITFGTMVTLLQLHKLDKPYIFSFCAGGEETPISIYITYSFLDRIKELIRNKYNSLYLYSAITRKVYSKSKLILTVTDESKLFLKNLGVNKKIITEPAIGLSITDIIREKNIKSKVIYAGSLIYWKNVDIPIKAILGVEKKIILDIFGAGEKKKELEKYVLKNNLVGKVIFYSPISRDILFKKYIEYDLAVHASSHDSGSMFLLEAISNGVPVLFLDTGGPKEIFNGLDYPLKVDPNQSYSEIVNSFTVRINWFYENYESFMESFVFFQEKIIEKYDWDNKAKRMVEIYKEVLNENSPNS